MTRVVRLAWTETTENSAVLVVEDDVDLTDEQVKEQLREQALSRSGTFDAVIDRAWDPIEEAE